MVSQILFFGFLYTNDFNSLQAQKVAFIDFLRDHQHLFIAECLILIGCIGAPSAGAAEVARGEEMAIISDDMVSGFSAGNIGFTEERHELRREIVGFTDPDLILKKVFA